MTKLFKKFVYHKIDFNIVGLFLSALILRLFLANFGTLQLDHGTFVSWANSLALNGTSNFYDSWSDYLPGYLYVLQFLGKVNLLFPQLQTLTFKIPAMLADLFTGLLIYRIAKEKLKSPNKKRWALGLFVLYVFNPAIISNSTLWGQVDSLSAFFALSTIYFATKNKLFISSILISIGTLIKPQVAFVAPSILYLAISNKWKTKQIIGYGLVGFGVFVLGFVPFTNLADLIPFIIERLTISANQYPYGSINAFSFWGLFGFWKPDQVSSWIGLGVVLISNLLFFIKTVKRKNSAYLIAVFSLLTTFLFLTRIHERHLLPVLAPLLISSLEIFPIIFVYAGLSLTYIANLAYSYYWITDNYKQIFNPVMTKILIVFNLIMLGVFSLSLFNKRFKNYLSGLLKFKRKKAKVLNNKKLFKGRDVTKKAAKLMLATILLFSLFTRFYNLQNPPNEYFDEVYHVFTAKLMLHNDPKAWEWWNPHPEGFAYEWTHPPIAKLGMVVGMVVFGENSFGSRSVQAMLGVASIYLVYLITLGLFNDRKMALMASLLLSFDGLFLVMNRIGMNDTYLLFFLLLSFLCFLKDKYFFAAISVGLALASKWSAIYFLPILPLSHFVLRKKMKLNYLWFLVLPPLVYVASYTQMFTTGHSWGQFVEVQKQMWWYHTNLDAQHAYTSPAWSWPLLLRPIYLYDGGVVGGGINKLVSRIYAFGNPAVFWFGLVSVIGGAVISFQEKIKKLGLVIFSYLIFFIPWIASPRIMFLYHYLPSIPFLVIISSFVLRRLPRLILPVFISMAVLFTYFYPHWTAINIPESLDRSYYWFSSWR